MNSPIQNPEPITKATRRGGVVWIAFGGLWRVFKWLFIPPSHGGWMDGWNKSERKRKSSVGWIKTLAIAVFVILMLANYYHVTPATVGQAINGIPTDTEQH